jgi:hypothetical protein
VGQPRPRPGQPHRQLATAPDPRPAQPPREGALSFASFISHLGNYQFRREAPQARARYRIDTMKALEAPAAEVPLPPRLQLHQVIVELWHKNGAYERAALLEVIRKVPLCWGPWRGLKQVFKEAEEKGDTEILGALAARFDAAYATKAGSYREISRRTMGYLVRRAWRALRRTGQSLAPAYVDAAIDVLRAYDDSTAVRQDLGLQPHPPPRVEEVHPPQLQAQPRRAARRSTSGPSPSCGAAPRGRC